MSTTPVLSRSSRVVATADHVSSNLGDEEVILDLTSDTYYGLNDVGTAVWRLVNTPRRVDEICTILEAEYDVDPDVLERDVLRLLDDLHRRGLVRLVS